MDFSRFGIALASWHSLVTIFKNKHDSGDTEVEMWNLTKFRFSWKNQEADIQMSMNSPISFFSFVRLTLKI